MIPTNVYVLTYSDTRDVCKTLFILSELLQLNLKAQQMKEDILTYTEQQ